MEESCGKCIPCRAATVKLYQLLNKVREGQGTAQNLVQIEQLCDLVQATSLCGLGQSAPNPVLSTLRYFRHEYEALLEAASSQYSRPHSQQTNEEEDSHVISPTV